MVPSDARELGRIGRIGGVLAGLLAVGELVRVLVTRRPLFGWGAFLSHLGAIAFVGLLAVSAVGLLLHRRFGWAFGVFGALVGVAYGVMITAGGAGHTHAMWGAVYLFGAVALLACLAKSFAVYRLPLART